MSRKRRILILTEAQYSRVRQAMRYVQDMYGVGDGGGDVTHQSHQWGRANECVLKLVEAAPKRDLAFDWRALNDVFEIAVTSSCNCLRGVESGKRKNGTHASDCIVTTHRATFERIAGLRKLFFNGAIK